MSIGKNRLLDWGWGSYPRLNPFRSLPARISLFVFGATLVTSLFVTGVSVNSIRTFLHGKIELKFPEIAEEASQKLNAWYDQQTLNLEVLAASGVLKSHVAGMQPEGEGREDFGASRDVTEYLSYVRDRFAHFDSLFILRPSGETLIWVGRKFELSSSLRDEILESQRTAKPVLSIVGEHIIQIVSVHVEDANGKPVGLLCAVMPLDAASDTLRTQRLGRRGQVHIENAAGIFLAVGRSHTEVGLFGHPREARQGSVSDYVDHNGDRVIGYSLTLLRYDLLLTVEEPYSEAFAPLLSAYRRVLSINLLIVLLFGFAAYQIAASIARPIEALSDAARRISEDEEDVIIPENLARDEVGVLTRTFSEMTARLANRAEALERSQSETEQAVQQMREKNAELQRVNEVLEQLSITDGLTQLHNHRFFQEQLSKEIKLADRVGNPLALVLIDIDHFKKWNDHLGHAGGDEILREIARLMNELVRETDILARYGGEEFAMILPKTNMAGAVRLAEKIRSTVAASSMGPDVPHEGMNLTVSIGVNVYDGNPSSLFTGADQALYRAKNGGRDCVMTEEDLG